MQRARQIAIHYYNIPIYKQAYVIDHTRLLKYILNSK